MSENVGDAPAGGVDILDRPAKAYLYKCRRCGVTFEHCIKGGRAFSCVCDIVANGQTDGPLVLHLHEVHFCEDKQGLGVADCIGAIVC